MRDYFELPSTPAGEDCAQVGTADYHDRATKECQAFIRQLKRTFGDPPAGVRLAVHANDHDFGTYYDIRLSFENTDPIQVDYACRVDDGISENWDDQARNELFVDKFPGGVQR
jgi:hypothetical protein